MFLNSVVLQCVKLDSYIVKYFEADHIFNSVFPPMLKAGNTVLRGFGRRRRDKLTVLLSVNLISTTREAEIEKQTIERQVFCQRCRVLRKKTAKDLQLL